MSVRELTAELVSSPAADFGEGPLWDDTEGVLWWTDIVGSAVHRYDPRSGTDTRIDVERTVGAIALRASGGLVVAARGGFGALALDGTIELLAAVNDEDPSMRMNDGKCDRAGRFYASTMAFAATPGVGELVRMDSDRSVHVQDKALTIGNGLAWTADGSRLYFVETMSGGVDVFDVDVVTGDLSNRRRAFDIPAEAGLPDGMCIDDEGALWVAMWQGGAVRRYSPAGDLLAVVNLPVSNVTCPAFAGPGLDQLWITTAAPRHADSAADEPLGGALFRVDPGVTGPPPAPYRG
ncbi:MAG: SMP-30/gluconolactonase/LRE family protein [Frankiaceae bacterium]|nr:SMP-30/gluconolactonase/LRE family protein [Frankiaceae bacterium]